MKETYDIIIEKLQKDKKRFEKDINNCIDLIDINDYAKMTYYKAKACVSYANELIEFFNDVRNNL